jgi:hypothetical protein
MYSIKSCRIYILRTILKSDIIVNFIESKYFKGPKPFDVTTDPEPDLIGGECQKIKYIKLNCKFLSEDT